MNASHAAQLSCTVGEGGDPLIGISTLTSLTHGVVDLSQCD